jgi:Uncharacterized protein conserved in bacteria (DUF2252)
VWKAPKDRQDPVELLIQSSKDRIPHLVSIRYGRMMMESPFAFYRGAAAIMAAVRSPFGFALTALSRLL